MLAGTVVLSLDNHTLWEKIDSLVFKVRILVIFAYVNHVILAGWVGGASQTNGTSRFILWRCLPAVPLLRVLLKVVSQKSMHTVVQFQKCASSTMIYSTLAGLF